MGSKKSGLGCIPIIGIAIALGLGGRYLSRQVLGKELTPIDAAEVIPNDAIFATFVETDVKKWSQVKALGNSQSQKILETQIEKLQAEISSEAGDFDYERDIQPWLDGAMIAFISEDFAYPSADPLVVLGIKNKLKANDFVKQFQTLSEATLKESKYKGIKITESISQNNDLTISALIGNRLLLAEEKEVIEQAINAYKDDTSLADDPQNKKVFEQELDAGTTLGQVYFPNYGESVAKAIASKSNSPNLNSELLSIYTSIESSVIALGVEPQGLRLQSITKFTGSEFGSSFTPNKSNLLKRFPDRTIASINGKDISQLWEQVLVFLKQNRDTSRYLNIANLSVRQTTKLNLESDIFNWMDGEFALGIISTPKSLHPDLKINFSAGLILETSQPEKAKETLAKLEDSAKQHLKIFPRQNKISKKAVTRWRTPGVDGGLNYGWLDKNNLLFTWDDFAFESISQSRKKSLAKSKSFKAMSKKLSDDNSGYLYIDVAQMMTVVNQMPIPKSNPDAEKMIALLNSLEAISSTVTMPDKYTAQQDLYILFKEN